MIANVNHLSKIVHFGAEQFFAGVATYTCLLFLQNMGCAEFEFIRVDDLESWESSKRALSGLVPATKVSEKEWNFIVGPGATLFDRLGEYETCLGEVASIFVGLQTSADKLYVLEEVENLNSNLVKVRDQNGEEWILEKGALRPFLKSVTVSGYETPISRHWLVFPYRITQDKKIALFTSKEMQTMYPIVWQYLKRNLKQLRQREKGKADHDEWFGYIYRKNLTLFDASKLIVQVISLIGRYAYDQNSIYFSGGGNGPYYGVRWSDETNNDLPPKK